MNITNFVGNKLKTNFMDNKWTTKRYLRSVSNFHLWNENPRLDPTEIYLTTKDYVEGMFRNESGREDFVNLAKSIVENGFLSLDPIVIWKNDKGQYVVAEGNRRIAVIKLLLDPQKAPKSIRRAFISLSSKIDKNKYEKIPVCVAPSFNACIWYINQRHEAKSTQKRWGRENYMIWISTLYDRFGKDIKRVKLFTGATESEIVKVICILRLKEKLCEDLVGRLTESEIDKINSSQFPITTFERVVNNSFAKNFFKLNFESDRIIIKAEYNSFLDAFAVFFHRLLLPNTDELYIDSRSLNTSDSISAILAQLPTVTPSDSVEKEIVTFPSDNDFRNSRNTNSDSQRKRQEDGNKKDTELSNPNRPHIIPNECCMVNTDFRLNELFKELKKLPVRSYANVACAALRVFLDISVRNYLRDNNWVDEIISQNRIKDFEKLELHTRVNFLCSKMPNGRAKEVCARLVNPQNDFSIATLNRYVHSNETYAIGQDFVNRFWDSMYPLLKELAGISEDYN